VDHGLLGAAAGLFGLLVGSFLNVVIWRVPRGESIVSPPSACPRCGARVRQRDNVPVLSWLLLRGRCRDCAEPISARYPAVELLTAAVFAVLALRVGPQVSLVAFLYFGAVGVALALIDWDTKRLPDALTLPAYPVSLALLAVAAVAGEGAAPLVRAAVSGLAVFAFFFLICLIYPAGMGFGDVKLSGLLGIFLGWISYGAVPVGIFAGFFLGGLVSVLLVVFRGAGRKTQIPFGPFLLAGCLLGVLGGDQLASGYLRWTTGS
jgi:leader peptidase (prepilin peptidase)/N-methyltransferase